MARPKKDQNDSEIKDVLLSLQDSLCKEFGEGAASPLSSSDALSKIGDSISSRSIVIDAVLRGGRKGSNVSLFPCGRQVEISGPPGSGKCLTGDNYVFSELGLLTIKEIFEENDLVSSCTTRDNPKEFGLQNRHGIVEKTDFFTNNGRKSVYRIETKSGGHITATSNHPHLVMSKSGNWIWKKTNQLVDGDVMISSRGGIFGKDCIDKNLAYFLGVAIADGTFENNRVQITNDDPCIKIIIRGTGSQVFKVPNEYDNNQNGSISFHFSIKEKVQQFYSEWGFKAGVAKDKNFSKQIRKLDRISLASVVRGYVDCEAWFSDNGIEIASASFELLHQFRMILQLFGIRTYLRKKFVAEYPDNDYFNVTIPGDEASLYMRLIGTGSLRRAKEAEIGFMRDKGSSPAQDYVPNCCELISDLYESTDFTTRSHAILINHILFGNEDRELTKKQLDKILAVNWSSSCVLDRLKEIAAYNYIYDFVKSVEYIGDEPTFDFSIPVTHSFVANGFVTHNTTMCAQVAAEVQSRGGVVITIDTEERIDEEYWTSLGVDCGRVLRAQAHTLEEVFNKQESILRNLVEKSPDTMGVMIYDSLGSTSSDEIINFDPKKGTFMDSAKQAFGRDAKVIGLGLKGLNGLISKSNICYMYTNHIYTKMNAGHGDPYETYGGLKAKFMATVRLRLQRIGAITEDDDTDNKLTTGIRVRVKALKNSMSPHLLEKDAVLIGGKGFSNDYTVFELGKKLGFVSTSGSWSTATICGEEIKFQGFNGFMEKVVTHPKYAELLQQVSEAL